MGRGMLYDGYGFSKSIKPSEEVFLDKRENSTSLTMMVEKPTPGVLGYPSGMIFV